MTVFEPIETLRKSKGISQRKSENELGYSNGYIGQLRKGIFPADRLKEIAEYLGVSTDYLMTGEEPSVESQVLTAKDERDIAKDMEALRKKLKNNEEDPVSYDGEPIPDEDAELLLGQIELMMRRLKPINKEKYNTWNPFELAGHMNVQVMIGELGCRSGCYIFLKNHKCIFLNENPSEQEMRVVMAHEPGHAILHMTYS